MTKERGLKATDTVALIISENDLQGSSILRNMRTHTKYTTWATVTVAVISAMISSVLLTRRYGNEVVVKDGSS